MSSTPDPNSDKKKSPWVQVGRYSQIAFMLPAGSVAGYLIGALADRWLHTNWISVVGLVLGTAGGVIELLRVVLRDTK
jgi:F0F1-type ATP synthase assembly protein I